MFPVGAAMHGVCTESEASVLVTIAPTLAASSPTKPVGFASGTLRAQAAWKK
jgi:hypothetical protein